MTTWQNVLEALSKGDTTLLKQLNRQKKAFRWYTKAIEFHPSEKNTFKGAFQETCLVEPELQGLEQNFATFQEYLDNPLSRYATCFLNPVKNCLLVIPVPMRQGKKYRDFASIFQFQKNASETQKKAFWKFAAHHIKCMAKAYGKIWVNAHGLGVPYFHLRIDIQPKYYPKHIQARFS